MADTRILLVDDEKEVTALLAKRLVRRGYQCDTAAAGLQAVEAMREQPFPIVVMDVKMPNMDGIAALKIIVEQWPTAQVILLSGHADMQLAVQAMSAEYLVRTRGQLKPGVVSVPAEIDDNIARRKLKAMGVSIDSLRFSQKEYLNG